jgi:hypothetical protein
MGIRPGIWAIATLGIAAFILLVLWGNRDPQPAGNDGFALRASGEGRSGRPGAVGSRALQPTVASGRPDGAQTAFASPAITGRRAPRTSLLPAVAERGSPEAFSQTTDGERVWWPHRPEDRALERKVVQLGATAGVVGVPEELSELAANGDSDSHADEGIDEEISSAADAVLTRYLLLQALAEEFPGATEFVPYGYPVEQVRQEVAQQVAGLSAGDRQRLLEDVYELQLHGGPGKPIMSHRDSGVVYEGPDWEDPNPEHVDVDRDPQSLEK